MEAIKSNLTINDLIEKIKAYNNNEDELKLIRKAYEYAEKKHFGQKRITGDDYIQHPLNVALILTDISADYKAIIAALLHDTIEDSDSTKEEITSLFDEEIALLVDGVTKINKINFSSDSEQMAANQRKILVGLIEDVRVIIVKLADRLHNMRTLYVLSEEKQKRKARETLEILTPVAHRLGMYKLKSELEDLSLKYLKPEAYNDIIEKLNQMKTKRDEAVGKMMHEVSELLNSFEIRHEIKGRSKSIYSIYNKLSKGRTWDDIYDILALRVFVDTEQECYLALGLIHSKYKPVPKRFKDFIAMPKTNLYQSLHTTVFGIDEQLFEIQIRTYEMDKIAEYGIASHWSYKENSDGSSINRDTLEQKLQIFRSIIELNDENVSSEEFISSIKKDVLTNDSIFVYTPNGDVMELPNGSTPVDFAYKVHSEIGDHMVGAIVNETIVPLDYQLKSEDIIKINTSKSAKGPNKDWLNFVATSQARNKIKSFYNKKEKNTNLDKGIELLEKEIRKHDIGISNFLSDKNISVILENYKLNSLDELYISLGSEKISPSMIYKLIYPPKEEAKDIEHYTHSKNRKILHNDVLVEGMGEIKSTLSNCCKPVYGDKIIGYITKGSGITIHRSNCKNIIDVDERLINVKWNSNVKKKFPSDIMIFAQTDCHLLDIITLASTSNLIIDSVNTINKSDSKVFIITVLVDNKDKLEKYCQDLLNFPAIKKVERMIN